MRTRRRSNDSRVVTVAVQIRRGDQASAGRKVVHDEFYVGLLRQLRHILEKAGKIPEVHVFSEDYGMINLKKKMSAVALCPCICLL